MRIAVLGIGVMGSAIADRLIQTGATVRIFDTIPSKLLALEARGAHATGTAAAAVEQSDFVIASLNSALVVEQVVFGEDGVACSADPGKLLIDMSSIDAGRTASMAERLQRETGMGWVDAPLSGGAAAAKAGTLTLMVGGEDAHFQRARPVLEMLAANFTHFGQPGAGQTVKLINQILCAAYFMAVAESVRFAEDHGVDASLIPAGLAGGRGDSRILQEFMGKMARRDFSPTGRIDNMLKDLETVGTASITPLPVTERITEIHRRLVSAGFGPADSAEYIRLFDLDSPVNPHAPDINSVFRGR